jgi:hypothetical protein
MVSMQVSFIGVITVVDLLKTTLGDGEIWLDTRGSGHLVFVIELRAYVHL